MKEIRKKITAEGENKKEEKKRNEGDGTEIKKYSER
jgi:hypothetical protein